MIRSKAKVLKINKVLEQQEEKESSDNRDELSYSSLLPPHLSFRLLRLLCIFFFLRKRIIFLSLFSRFLPSSVPSLRRKGYERGSRQESRPLGKLEEGRECGKDIECGLSPGRGRIMARIEGRRLDSSF